MDAFLHQVFAGLATGGIYASLALALVMLFWPLLSRLLPRARQPRGGRKTAHAAGAAKAEHQSAAKFDQPVKPGPVPHHVHGRGRVPEIGCQPV